MDAQQPGVKKRHINPEHMDDTIDYFGMKSYWWWAYGICSCEQFTTHGLQPNGFSPVTLASDSIQIHHHWKVPWVTSSVNKNDDVVHVYDLWFCFVGETSLQASKYNWLKSTKPE